MSLRVRLLALRVVHLAEDDPDAHPEEGEDGAHPAGVPLGQVVVHRDDVDALAGEAVEVRGGNAGQGFPFAGLHLRDPPLVEDDGAHELHVEDPLSELPARRLAHQGVCLGEKGIDPLSAAEALAELRGLLREVANPRIP